MADSLADEMVVHSAQEKVVCSAALLVDWKVFDWAVGSAAK